MSDTKNAAKSKKGKPPRAAGDWIVTQERVEAISHPADYTFMQFTEPVSQAPENARISRQGLLNKGPSLRLMSRGLWLNNNNLRTLKNLKTLTDSVLESPHRLSFLDVSCNDLTHIDDDILEYKNITILYLHGNQLNDPAELFKLRQLKNLRHLTIYGNPLCRRVDLGNIRKLVVSFIPTLRKLDYNRYTPVEKDAPLATQALKILRQIEGPPEDWLFKKFPVPKMTKKLKELCGEQGDVKKEDEKGEKGDE